MVVKQYLKSILISYAFAFILLVIVAGIFAYTDVQDSMLSTFVFAIAIITSLFGSLMISRKMKKMGFIYGLIFGIIYFLILYLLSVILYTGFFINKSVLIYMLMIIISSVIGGIVGVNI